MTVINLRGTNGSGKSHVARSLINSSKSTREIELAIYHGQKKPKPIIGYEVPEKKLIVVGPYRVLAGGCDRIFTQDLVCEAVTKASQLAVNVFFEGLLVSGLFSRYLDISKQLNSGIIWAFLDTPLEICLTRVSQRFQGRPLKNEGGAIKSKYFAVQRVRTKALAAGERVIDIDYLRAVAQIEGLFNAE